MIGYRSGVVAKIKEVAQKRNAVYSLHHPPRAFSFKKAFS